MFLFFTNMRTLAVSFKSNIHLVSLEKFYSLSEKNAKEISYVTGEDIKEGERVFTEKVRTCSAGGVKNGSAMRMFHLFPSTKNVMLVDDIAAELFKGFDSKPVGGLLLGGKDSLYHSLSLPLFQKLKKALQANVKNLSIFQTHTNLTSETNLFMTG